MRIFNLLKIVVKKYYFFILLSIVLSTIVGSLEPIIIAKISTKMMNAVANNDTLIFFTLVIQFIVSLSAILLCGNFILMICSYKILPSINNLTRNMAMSFLDSLKTINIHEGNIVNKVDNFTEESTGLIKILMRAIFPGLIVIILSLYQFFNLNKYISIITMIWLFLHICIKLTESKIMSGITKKKYEMISNISGYTSERVKNKNIVDFFNISLNINTENIKSIYQKEIISIYIFFFLRAINVIIFQVFAQLSIWYLWKNNYMPYIEVYKFLNLNLALVSFAWEFSNKLSDVFLLIGRYNNAAELFNIPNVKTPVIDNTQNIQQIKKINIENLSFGYKDKYIIKNFSFQFKAGDCVAVLGESGIGKSTFLTLLAGLVPDYTGKILFNDIELSSLSNNNFITYIFADTSTFNDTVYNNIKFGKENATEEEIITASNKAMSKLPLDTMVGSSGKCISSGQAQRIAIARAFMRDTASLLIADEPFRCLSKSMAEEVFNNLQLQYKNGIMIISDHTSLVEKKANIILHFSLECIKIEYK